MMSVALGSIAADDPDLAIELLVAFELPGSYRIARNLLLRGALEGAVEGVGDGEKGGCGGKRGGT